MCNLYNIIDQEMNQTKENNSPPTPNICGGGVLILGETGVGKSNLGNFLLKSENKFKISNSLNSETQSVLFGQANNIAVLDSPGINDSSCDEEKEEEHLVNIVKEFKKAKYLSTILIVINYQTPRLSKNLNIMIKLFCSIFKISFFLKHLGVVFTRCYDEDGRPSEEELLEKKNMWDSKIKEIIKSTLINETLTDEIIQYFFLNLNPKKKKLEEKTGEELQRLRLWIMSNKNLNTDIVEESEHPGYKEEYETETVEETSIEGEEQIIKIFEKKRKKLIFVDGSIKYDGDWEKTLIDTKVKPIEGIEELNKSIRKFQEENTDLFNQLEEAKKNNGLELEKLKLEYQARVEEARAVAAERMAANNRNTFGQMFGLMMAGIFSSVINGRRSERLNDIE